METCEVLVVGGGPAGSTCAGKLVQAGLDVLLLDKETFPREKLCAGWITPAVFAALELDAEEYRQGRVLQDISGFRTGLIGGAEIVTDYGAIVSYGVRRYEFDHYLLQRSRICRQLGQTVTTLDWKDGWWLVNKHIRARLLVGAGGHFCPVARLLGASIGHEEVVAAQATEYAMSPAEEQQCSVRPDTPVLFFCRDMKGYGWMFRKGNWLNIGLGRRDTHSLSRHTSDFCRFIEQQGGLPGGLTGRLRGHTYRLYGGEGRRRCVGDGALLIGDAAGVANPDSGEGILPSLESALLAAEVIVAANGDYRRDNLEPYAERLKSHFGSSNPSLSPSQVSSQISCYLGTKLLSNSWFTRHIVLNRWFLRR
ncbi:MAG: NAD(P)/FAD-dependent oxidoreductase [Desulfuromonadaceae bacterium]|nr:NAD(P)/FAD-dependent oxidoreductase [Desulfuromonadaceae bacterium]MDD2849079.1 NAD(P)/FAD-dependent oxidoreductase [Desulfuromonadaceae bacterium]MDD4131763.1 NAD(P)/FAD-dependent oxidoreductase [Desulfuromonadaceae bacterium]